MSQTFGIISMHPGSLLGADELETSTGLYFRALEALGGERRPDNTSSADGEHYRQQGTDGHRDGSP
jgi:hypothetical protein